MKFNYAIPFQLFQIKYLTINLTKYEQDLHAEHHKMMMKETKANLNNGRNFSYLRTRRCYIAKMSSLQIKLHV